MECFVTTDPEVMGGAAVFCRNAIAYLQRVELAGQRGRHGATDGVVPPSSRKTMFKQPRTMHGLIRVRPAFLGCLWGALSALQDKASAGPRR